MKKTFLLFASCLLSLLVFSQTTPCRLRISMLTCGPGEDLYSIFGHTGLRVIDSAKKTDFVFNYGTFDDSDPYFYIKFTRGIMLYSLSMETFPDFMEEYQQEKRSVTEQVLGLNCEEKNKLLIALQTNAQESNRYYQYRFHTDNCTTRAGDMVADNISAPVFFKDILPEPHPTFRQLINGYLNRSGACWSKLGINLFLGSHLDAQVTNRQAMFLPDLLMKGLDSASVHEQPLVDKKEIILPASDKNESMHAWLTPGIIFTTVFLVVLLLTFSKKKQVQAGLRIFDRFLFLVTGLLGVIMLFLWLGRIDTVCRNNFNLIWALPTHAITAFVPVGKKKWITLYWMINSIILGFLLIAWKLLPQELNNALLPWVALLLSRSFIKITGSKTASAR